MKAKIRLAVLILLCVVLASCCIVQFRNRRQEQEQIRATVLRTHEYLKSDAQRAAEEGSFDSLLDLHNRTMELYFYLDVPIIMNVGGFPDYDTGIDLRSGVLTDGISELGGYLCDAMEEVCWRGTIPPEVLEDLAMVNEILQEEEDPTRAWQRISECPSLKRENRSWITFRSATPSGQ